MSSLLIASLLIAQAKGQIEPGPMCPPGTSAAFQNNVRQILDLMEVSKFAEAKKLLPRLPDTQIEFSWDDSNVPEVLRAGFIEERDRAISTWMEMYPDLKIVESKTPDVTISFADELAINPDSGIPYGHVVFETEGEKAPYFESIIGLNRMKPSVPTERNVIGTEVSFLIGNMLGLAPAVRPGGAMGRLDTAHSMRSAIIPYEIKMARENIAITKQLKKAIEEKKPLRFVSAEIGVQTQTLDYGTFSQGDVPVKQVEVTNLGTGKLSFIVQPDCSCFRVDGPRELAPGQSGILNIYLDSTEFPGKQDKKIAILSNDPDRSTIVLPVKGFATPAYRFLNESSSTRTLIMPANGAKSRLYLAYDPAKPFKIQSIEVSGVSGIADYSAWKGSLPDPVNNESPMDREGYAIDLLLSPSGFSGRMPVTIAVKTDHPVYSTIFYQINVQKGLAMVPTNLYIGRVKNVPQRVFGILSHPKGNVKILSVTTNSEYFKAHVEQFTTEESKIVVEYDGKAPAGLIGCTVTIKTDDPETPLIEYLVQGQTE
ncbi:MAG: DUF1573 domain-containing protein [Armatimonadetes bacterium]|nr:DUF1573 domain-containing protein [Armatimonadota bacterium]